MPPTSKAAVLALSLTACSAEEPPEESASSRQPPAAEIVAIRHGLPIFAQTSRQAPVVGRLRLGARAPRAAVAEPATEDCARGWYAIEPRGFVCLDEGALLESDDRALPAPGSRPLPYRYARVRRGGAVAYGAIPTRASLLVAESEETRPANERRLGAGANDVPVDDDGFPTGPAVVVPAAWGVGAKGYRTSSNWFLFDGPPWELEPGDRLGPVAPTVLAELAARVVVEHETLRRRSGVAIAATTEVDGRRYAITPEGRVIGADRLEPALGTSWHGVDLREAELPLGFALRAGVRARSFRGSEPTVEPTEYYQNEPIFLSGRYRTAAGRRYYHTKRGHWLRHEDLIVIHPRREHPDFAIEGARWLDVSLANQTLVAYEGKKPVYATLISSGRQRIGDPDQEPATPQGVFRVVEKAVTVEVDSREVDDKYTLEHAPWALVTDEPRLVIHGNYWQHRFAWARGQHHITVAPVDAHWLFRFATPALPEGWHAVRAEAGGTTVYVHK